MSLGKRFLGHTAAGIAALLLGGAPFAAHASNIASFGEQALLAQGAQINHHTKTGQVNFIGSNAGSVIALPSTGTSLSAAAAAQEALNAYGPMFGLSNPATELSQTSLRTLDSGRSVVRYQQNYNGIPVIGGEIIVNLSQNNGLLAMNGETSPKLRISTQAQITAQQAKDNAVAAVARWYQTPSSTLSASTPTLSIYDPQLIGPDTFPAKLVWRVEVSSLELKPIRELVLVDALRGNIRLHFNQVDTALALSTHDAGGTATLPGPLVCTEADLTCAAGSADAKSAHTFAQDTYNFYSTTHTRDGIDNAGGIITSTVNYYQYGSCPNAYWDGTQMVYCAGLVVDDVVAHELTHGVTDNTSNLFYYYQSGAINESFSDVWGEFVDLSNTSGTDTAATRWLMGEDATIIGGAIRSMKDPTLYGDPDKMTSSNYWTDYTDQGGVHTNSGINNKAAYLMVDGDSFNGQTVKGLGITKVAKIYYEVQTNLLTSGADYLDLYIALNKGCENLIGTAGITSADCTQVHNATMAVEMYKQPVAKFNPDATACPAGKSPKQTAFFDNMETGLAKWTLTNSGGFDWVALNATYGASYATSGIESLLGDDTYFAATDQRAAISFTVPSNNSYLHFKHAFDFEAWLSTAYDGGVLEYSKDGGATWNDAGPLIQAGQNYNSKIVTGSNPLADRNAFTGTSHGYVATRVKLGGMNGQTVQFRWRIATDGYGAGPMGWVLDDVGVYDCPSVSTSSDNTFLGLGALGWPFLLLVLLLIPLRKRFPIARKASA